MIQLPVWLATLAGWFILMTWIPEPRSLTDPVPMTRLMEGLVTLVAALILVIYYGVL